MLIFLGSSKNVAKYFHFDISGIKKNIVLLKWVYQFYGLAAISVGRLGRGNKQDLNFSLICVIVQLFM
jgi:hypothetical protein